MSVGHTIDDLAQFYAKVKGISVQDAMRFLSGKDFASTAQANLMARGGQASAIGRMAGSKAANKVLRLVPGLGIGLTALDAADVVTSDTSFGNKAMDATSMAVGGTIGGVVGLGNPLAIATGASIGKALSDGTQFLLGGGESAEERKLREALELLQRGTY